MIHSLAPTEPMTLFTVYRGTAGIELHSGYEDRQDLHVLQSCKSYEAARDFAQVAANHRGVMLKDFVREPHLQT